MTDREKAIEYAESINPPAEIDFFTSEQLEALKKEREKMEQSRVFVLNIIEKDDFEELIQKAALENRIYNVAEMSSLKAKFRAIDEGLGDRVEINRSLITKTGQKIIASAKLQDLIKIYSDVYFLEEELDILTKALKAEGIDEPDIDRVASAMRTYGAVIIQRGVFTQLKSLLEDAVGSSLTINKSVENDAVSVQMPQDKAKKQNLPVSEANPQNKNLVLPADLTAAFVEYLKHNDISYTSTIKSVISDPKFIEFFEDLKKNYNYYKNLANEKMVEEIIQHPPLWNKLSGATSDSVRQMVERNKEGFDKKKAAVAQSASSEHGASLSALKERLIAPQQPKAENEKSKTSPITFAEELKREVNTPELNQTKQTTKPPEAAKIQPPRQRLPQKEQSSKNAWMISERVVSPKQQQPGVIAHAPKRIPKVRSRVARFGLKELKDIKSLDDLSRIEAAHLRQGPLLDQISDIKAKIIQSAKDIGVLPLTVLPMFEKSPLFQTYLQAGAMLIEKNAGMEDKLALDEVMAELEDMGQDTLTQEEFEAIADLKKDLGTLSGL